jgi:S1-C subfamily serine protease
LIAIIVSVGAVFLVGVVVGAYFLFRDKPKGTVKVEPAKVEPARVEPHKVEPHKVELPRVEPPRVEPPRVEPVKELPKAKEPPKTLTQEQTIRKVKASTVYVRTYVAQGVAMGTGFFASKPGFVVTNAHIIGYERTKIHKITKVEIVIDSGELTERTIPAKVYGVDIKVDLALLQVGEPGLPPPLAFGKAEELTETQEVVTFGYLFGEALGKNISINRTTVSTLRKLGGTLELVQLVGTMNPGTSGGPLTNTKGEVVGMCVAKILKGTDILAYAIPVEIVERFIADQIRVGGSIPTQPE